MVAANLNPLSGNTARRISDLERRLLALENRKTVPLLSLGGLQLAAVAAWPSTSSGSWVTLASIVQPLIQPVINWNAKGYAPSGVTGSFRLLVGGVLVGAAWTATAATTISTQSAPIGVALGSTAEIDLQAEVTAGAGPVAAQLFGLWGTAT